MTKFREKFFLLFVLLLCLHIGGLAQTAYQRASLWEKEINAFAELDEKNFPTKTDVLFVGSSSIRGWRSLKDDFPKLKVLNRGFGGSHLEDVIFYSEKVVFSYKPKLIVLYAGENDLVAGKPVERVFEDFKTFVSLTRANLPRARLIALSVKPSPARWNFTPKFKEFNRLMKAETEKNERLLFVEVWTPMLDETGQPRKEIFLGDKLHMNPEGYKIWRAVLAPHIKAGVTGAFSAARKVD